MAELIVIPNWERDFENAKSRSVERTTFYICPNHFDGKKIRRLQMLKKSVELYGAFHAIRAVASRCRFRGVLLDHDGPIDALNLSAKTGFPPEPLQRAIDELSSPAIAMLEKHEIAQIDGQWILPDTVRQWAIPADTRRYPAIPVDTSRYSAIPEGGERKKGAAPRKPIPADTSRYSAIPADTAGTRGAAESPAGPLNGREGNGSEVPPTVPQGGQASADEFLSLTAPERQRLIEEAKGRTCRLKTFGGKDPARAWGREAMDGLTRNLPVPEIEWTAIEWFHGLPENDAIAEVKARRQSETTLWQNWSDEVQRANKYRRKVAGKAFSDAHRAPPQKKESPAGWAEFFRWKYDEDCELPEQFWQLDETQQREWEREHEGFERDVLPKLNIVKRAEAIGG